MSDTSQEWLEGQADRMLAHQRATVDTAKLVATFAAAVAAGLVGSALEIGTPSTSDRRAALLLALGVLLAIGVMLLDRIAVADHAVLLERAYTLGWDDDHLLRELRIATLTALRANAGVVRDVRIVLTLELFTTLAAGLLAAASLLDRS